MELLSQPIFDEEGLVVSLSPRGRVVMTLETQAEGVALTPEQSVALALELLGTCAPYLLDAIEREVQGQRLRLVQGGPPEDAA